MAPTMLLTQFVNTHTQIQFFTWYNMAFQQSLKLLHILFQLL